MGPNNLEGGLDGPVIFGPGPASENGDDARIEGTLILDGDCLLVGRSTSGGGYAVLWPYGTSWDTDDQAVALSSGAHIPVGTQFTAAGGFHSPEALRDWLANPDLVQRAEACVTDQFPEIALAQHAIGPK